MPRWPMPEPAHREVVGGCPLDCPDGCSWIVTVDGGGVPVKLRGNPAHPFTRGGLCVKVNGYLEQTRRTDRLLHPLRRVGAKGEGRFVRISWDEALDEIADRLTAIRAEHGGEAIWPYLGTGTVGWIQGIAGAGKRLWNALGCSDHAATICSVSGHAGMRYTTGSALGMEPSDLVHSRLILLWGTNTLTSNQHLWPFVEQARGAGAHVVVVDPVRTRTARRADEHVALRPGTDGALALGLLHVAVAEGGADEAWLDRWSVGWEAFRDLLAAWTPARAAAVCDVPEAQIRDLGTRLASARPTGIRLSMGMQRHAGGASAARTVSTIPAVLGDFARVGGGICYSTAPGYPLDGDALTRPDLRPKPVRTLYMTRLADTLLDAVPPVRALLVFAANPVASNPDQREVRRALSRPDLFTVVVEQFPTDTADYADIVLPGTMQTEHADLHDSFSHLYLQWNEPAVPPAGECLPHTEIARRLAVRMGITDPAVLASDDDLARAALGGSHPALAGITLERLRAEGFVRMGFPEPYLPFADGFPTPSGRFTFTSRDAVIAGLPELPDFVPPAEAIGADERHPLALVAPADHHFLNSVFASSPAHLRRAGEPVVSLHPLDAAARGVVDGDRVRVRNDRGAFEAVAVLDGRARPGLVVTTKGWWPKLAGGATANATVAERDSDLGHGAVYHDNRVEVSRLDDAGPPSPR
jgi:anaerobic selenocysteine-containing dehydrogenase